MTLTPIDNEGLRNCIHVAFGDDKELPQYHINGEETTDCAALSELTYQEIVGEISKVRKYSEVLAVKVDDKMIGFTVITHKFIPLLYSFGIAPAYRQSPILEMWLKAVRQRFDDGFFYVGLNMKNTRAIGFFERNGYVIENRDNENKIVLLCPSLVEYQQQ